MENFEKIIKDQLRNTGIDGIFHGKIRKIFKRPIMSFWDRQNFPWKISKNFPETNYETLGSTEFSMGKLEIFYRGQLQNSGIDGFFHGKIQKISQRPITKLWDRRNLPWKISKNSPKTN